MRVDGELGIPKDSSAGRRMFSRIMEDRRKLDDPELYKSVRHGWFLGDEEFRQELLEQMHKSMGRHHGGIERQETAEAQAGRLLRKELDRAGLTTARLEASPKSSPAKVKIALIHTTMAWDWIAQRLTLGSAGYAAHRVRQYAKMRD